MRAVVSRVTSASVSVDGRLVGELPAPGLLALVGVTHTDDLGSAARLANKIATLRILRSDSGAEVSAADMHAPLLIVSQFTLYGDSRKGRRPTWSAAAPGEMAEPLVAEVVKVLRDNGLHVETGEFGAMMAVASVNDGPFTLIVET